MASQGTDRVGKGASRRTRVLTEARAHLVDVGVEGFSVRQVAAAADISLGNLQYYFPSRRDLLAAVVAAEIESDAALIRSLHRSDPVDELGAVVAELLRRWSADHDSVYVALVVVARQSPEIAELTARVWDRAYDEIAAVLCRIDEDLRPTEARARAMVIVSLVDGAALQHYAARGRCSRVRIARDIVDVAVAIGRGRLGPVDVPAGRRS